MNDRNSEPRTDRRAMASLFCAVYLIIVLIVVFLEVTHRVRTPQLDQRIGGVSVIGWLLLLCPVAALAGIGLGHLSRSAIRKSDGHLQGRGMATTGLTLVYISMVLFFAFVVPQLMRPHGGRGNESAAIANLRTIDVAEATYRSSNDRYGAIRDLVIAGLLDDRFDTFDTTVSGYRFDIQVSGRAYTATASPVSSDIGRFGYYSTADGVVRYTKEASLAPNGQAGQPVR